MRIQRPNAGVVIGCLALFVALGGTARAVTASKVNIADPTVPKQVAHVDAGGRLQIGGTVTAQAAAPSAYVRPAGVGVSGGPGCEVIATPPAGKALVVKQVRLDVYLDPSPGEGQNVSLWVGPDCSTDIVGDANPAGIGQIVIPFDPGLTVPKGSSLRIAAGGAVQTEVYVDSYTVGAGQVPALVQHARTPMPQS